MCVYVLERASEMAFTIAESVCVLSGGGITGTRINSLVHQMGDVGTSVEQLILQSISFINSSHFKELIRMHKASKDQ